MESPAESVILELFAGRYDDPQHAGTPPGQLAEGLSDHEAVQRSRARSDDNPMTGSLLSKVERMKVGAHRLVALVCFISAVVTPVDSADADPTEASPRQPLIVSGSIVGSTRLGGPVGTLPSKRLGVGFEAEREAARITPERSPPRPPYRATQSMAPRERTAKVRQLDRRAAKGRISLEEYRAMRQYIVQGFR